MKILDTLKSWLGLAPKPAAPPHEVREQTLLNGRVALTDEKGNFLGWKQ